MRFNLLSRSHYAQIERSVIEARSTEIRGCRHITPGKNDSGRRAAVGRLALARKIDGLKGL